MFKLRLMMVVAASLLALATCGSALASGDANAGDVWVDNVGQPAGPGHEMDAHLACSDIAIYGSKMADSTGSWTVYGWPPSGSQQPDLTGTWSYDQAAGGDQQIGTISISDLIAGAQAAGDEPHNGQGYHFKLQVSQDPQKTKTFWVNCSSSSGSSPSSSSSSSSLSASSTSSCPEEASAHSSADKPGRGRGRGKSRGKHKGLSRGKHRGQRKHSSNQVSQGSGTEPSDSCGSSSSSTSTTTTTAGTAPTTSSTAPSSGTTTHTTLQTANRRAVKGVKARRHRLHRLHRKHRLRHGVLSRRAHRLSGFTG
jgi:hypothetical protein